MVFGLKNLNKELDCYNTPLDHYNKQTKSAIFSRNIGARGGWHFGYRLTEHLKEYDSMILWCISEDEMSVERGYIIPKK